MKPLVHARETLILDVELSWGQAVAAHYKPSSFRRVAVWFLQDDDEPKFCVRVRISRRLAIDFPDDASMRINHEAIYQALYVQSQGARKRELVACLRTGWALRVPRSRVQRQAWAHVSEQALISERQQRLIGERFLTITRSG